MTKNYSPLLLHEQPITFYPALANKLGSIPEAIVLQQIHYWIQKEDIGKTHDGRHWVRNTIEQWQSDNFTFISEHTIRRTLNSLEKKGYVLSKNLNDKGYDRTLWYTIDYDTLNAAFEKPPFSQSDTKNAEAKQSPSGKNAKSCGQNGQMDVAKMDTPIPEITSETTRTKDIAQNKSAPKPRAKKQTAQSAFTTPIKNKLSEICFGRSDGWKTSASGLGKALRELSEVEPDLTLDMLNEFEMRWKRLDWRWTEKHQHLEPFQIVPAWLKYMPGKESKLESETVIIPVEPVDHIFTEIPYDDR